MNHVSLVGRITHDLQLKTTPSGKKVLNFTIAVSQPFSAEDRADFLPCVAWNGTAENTAKYCEKGSLIGVVGKLQRRTYENEKGQHSIMEVIASEIRFYSRPMKKDTLEHFTVPAVQQAIAP